MTYDCCGTELCAGDVVVYSNADDDGELVQEVYLVLELIDLNTCLGQLMNTKYAGTEQYLLDTVKRAAFVSESDFDFDEDDEEDGLPLSSEFN